jgi:hypothetical protein
MPLKTQLQRNQVMFLPQLLLQPQPHLLKKIMENFNSVERSAGLKDATAF